MPPATTDLAFPMVQTSMRFPIPWLKTLKSVAIRKRTGVSEVVREALELWAEKEGIDLGGF